MDPARSAPQIPPTSPANALSVWPQSTQTVVIVFLLGAVTALVAKEVLVSSRWSTRPTNLISGTHPSYRVDLNRADRVELMQLPGIGPALAGRIESHRDEVGSFHAIDDLNRVRGIGEAKLEAMRPWVKVEDSAPTQRPAKSQGKVSGGAALINLNEACASELERLPGIGPKLAQRIIDERRNGLFNSANDLKRVSGIGPKKIEAIRRFVTVSADSQVTASAP